MVTSWGTTVVGRNIQQSSLISTFLLMIRIPRHESTSGARTSALVESVDIYPTLIELAGSIDAPHELEGASLLPLIEEPQRQLEGGGFCSISSLCPKTTAYG